MAAILRGFDGCSVQGPIPHAAMRAHGMEFGIFKAFTGNDGPDPSFAANVAGAIIAGIEPFGYAFAYPLHDDPTGKHPGRDPEWQATAFVTVIWKHLPGKPIFIDLEWPSPQDLAKWGLTWAFVSNWCRLLCEKVTELCGGIRPIIYTYSDWWQHMAANADVSWAADYGLWMAWYVPHWPELGAKPTVRKPWIDWLFWQWDGNGGERMTNGVDADFCVFNGTKADLLALGSTVAAVTAPATGMPLVDWPIVHALPEPYELPPPASS